MKVNVFNQHKQHCYYFLLFQLWNILALGWLSVSSHLASLVNMNVMVLFCTF